MEAECFQVREMRPAKEALSCREVEPVHVQQLEAIQMCVTANAIRNLMRPIELSQWIESSLEEVRKIGIRLCGAMKRGEGKGGRTGGGGCQRE